MAVANAGAKEVMRIAMLEVRYQLHPNKEDFPN